MSIKSVKGLSELQKFLEALPANMEAKIMRSALRAGAKVILAEAKAKVPVAPPNAENQRLYGGYTGALRDSLRVTARLSKGVVTATVRAGGNKRGADVYYARWVEYGTAAHRIVPTNAKSLFFAGHTFSEGVMHPGALAKPFMRPAMHQKSQAALVAVGEAIKRRLTKQGIEGAADIEVEAE